MPRRRKSYGGLQELHSTMTSALAANLQGRRKPPRVGQFIGDSRVVKVHEDGSARLANGMTVDAETGKVRRRIRIRVSSDELREAQERAFMVAQMQEHGGWMALREDVWMHLEAVKRELLSGGAHERYAALCGFLSGARYVLETQERLEKQVSALRED